MPKNLRAEGLERAMDRITKAIDQLWGPISADGRLGPEPAFASELEAQCDKRLGLVVSGVSKWSVGHQLEHLYLTSHYVLDRLIEAMSGQNASKHMGPYGYGLMVGGFIPRGVFPTIPPLLPVSGTLVHILPLKDHLRRRLEEITWDLDEVKASTGKSRHPRMKYLTAVQWLYFAEIHHRHHLAIIRDICKVADGTGTVFANMVLSTKQRAITARPNKSLGD
jgi:hypothetical protein